MNQKVKSHLLLNGEISMNQFIQEVENKISILSSLDVLHSCKSGKNRVLDHDIKFGPNVNIRNKVNLEKNLKSKVEVLNEKCGIWRMNDYTH